MTDQSDWWTGFFCGPFLDVQLALGLEEKSRAEADFLEKLLALGSGARVLDVPCGTGRHSLELARRGHRVTGVDFNPKVLAVARAAAAAEGLEADFREGDMRALELQAEFAGAYCHWGSFGYFSDAENAAFLQGVSRALRPGARFFLDVHVAETLFPKHRPRDFNYWGEGERRTRVLEERRFDHERGRIETSWTFQKDGREQTSAISIRVYTYRELCALHEAAGLSVVSATDDAGKPFELGSSRLWLVTQKA